jgi:protoporphyrinogen oxidase
MNDVDAIELVRELGLEKELLSARSRTAMYYEGQFYRLGSPFDMLRLKALGPVDRMRLGWLCLRARAIRDWRALERETAERWIQERAGANVYRVIWEPLLRAKFGARAPEVSAVWFWNKLKLRTGSRRGCGNEILLYLRGGLQRLLDELVRRITAYGGGVDTNSEVTGLEVRDGRVTGVKAGGTTVPAERVIATPALPIIADLVSPHVPPLYVEQLRQTAYMANMCLVLELTRPLSNYYWLNVNDRTFPYLGIIEHTNLVPADDYAGRHIVYLSRYTSENDPLYALDKEELLKYSLAPIQRLFPTFRAEAIVASHLWKARYAQPVVERLYSSRIPSLRAPLPGLFVASMAQIYPEDRGTNYAIRLAKKAAGRIVSAMDDR